MNKKKYVYFFGEGNKDMKGLLGGKGAGLSEMTKIGIPVPAGFTITTDVCNLYSKNKKYPEGLDVEIEANMNKLEEKTGKKFGDKKNPLLVSVRSGAAVSMPGMMDTILNLGLNPDTVQGLIELTKNERFVLDSYRRFIQMFGNVVLGISSENFEKILGIIKQENNVKLDTELSVKALQKIVELYKAKVKEVTNEEFPEKPNIQLNMAINAVFDSWNNERAITYRKLNDISDSLGTAVNVQSMVFGNMGNDSGTGVAFTRNPSTGEKRFFGEYLMNAQGEDVVAGIRTPKEIEELKKDMPSVYEQLVDVYKKLELHYKDMQDIEFTIEKGKLFLLQTRTGKRTAHAAVKIAVDMVEEKLITKEEAVLRVEPNQLDQLLHKTIDPKAKLKVIAKGLPASPGAAVGSVVFNAEKAHDLNEEGRKVILVRNETSPEDIEGMAAAQGILTARGGMTSHAAVVARGMGKCCVAGCEKIRINEKTKEFKIDDIVVKENDIITLNGNTGEVILGKVDLIDPELKGEFKTLMKWVDSYRTLGVRTNADTPHDAEKSVEFGAEGIGLCRTEHMFFQEDRIKAVREMILAEDIVGRKKALDKLLPMQKSDFIGIFKVMNGLPVTIRLLDPPLHEFLPQAKDDIKELAKEMNVTEEKIQEKIISLHEINPMLGHRGCRLAITYPEIAEMQVKAIFEAGCELVKQGIKVTPEVMIPLVGVLKEFTILKKLVKNKADKIIKNHGVKLDYKIGTMIEIPRACIIADQIAKEAEFFSFGTNDLTQMTFGFSRDDVGKFTPEYVDKGILEKDPFQVLDQEGVGSLVKMGVEKGRKARKDLKIGICGEHGGEPGSVEFCHKVGMTYVSCSPFRVPIARLAAAHAKLKEK
ncbi:pyruvate, phosphate dikinase [Candidatus Woesearchaeota archaeon CG_4_10_14_0_2_um_filter_33_10]|nr:MAG: pyruvate, phosphate dikinase [Candidatus Woesearchaeota archaeon CG10_big_fil_rev_8_21_14_0_10_33_12]PIZ54023.1 MAG: pyruvate, phosphate dikinase [Candidatus Woesearchaeota archaeon CG_4_10_14_0_2_um_filter_33_10]